jgi:hypothetical protein
MSCLAAMLCIFRKERGLLMIRSLTPPQAAGNALAFALSFCRGFCMLIIGAWIFGPASATSAFGQATVNLYFMDPTHTHLAAQARPFPAGLDTVQSAHAILTALFEGPREGLVRTIPEELSLRAVFVTDDKTAYVDLAKRPEAQIYPDVFSEWLAISSIVNSLILNLPEIESVKIIVGGQEAETLSGHIDLAYPFKANMLLVR